MEGGVKLDRWGYEVKTNSDACISAINSYYHQVCVLSDDFFSFVWIEFMTLLLKGKIVIWVGLFLVNEGA